MAKGKHTSARPTLEMSPCDESHSAFDDIGLLLKIGLLLASVMERLVQQTTPSR